MCRSFLLLIHLLVWSSTTVKCKNDAAKSTSLLLSALADMERSLGFDEYKSQLDNILELHPKINGTTFLDDLATKVGMTLSGAMTAVRRLKIAIEKDYNRTDGPTGIPCCEFDENAIEEIDSDFGRKLDRGSFCYRQSGPDVIPIRTNQSILEVFKSNLDEFPLKWQYYGNVNGHHVSYPARHTKRCGDFDPRQRPWYAQGVLPLPKLVVLALDASGSMFGGSSSVREKCLSPNSKCQLARDTVSRTRSLLQIELSSLH